MMPGSVFGLPPFEDRRSGYPFAIVSRQQPATPKVATHPEALTVWRFGLLVEKIT
jgi:hypothetical protein